MDYDDGYGDEINQRGGGKREKRKIKENAKIKCSLQLQYKQYKDIQ